MKANLRTFLIYAIIINTILENLIMKTELREATWKTNLGKIDFPYDIVSTIVYQPKTGKYIAAENDFLLEIICLAFFKTQKEKNFSISFSGVEGMFFSKNYKLMMFYLINNALFNENLTLIKDETPEQKQYESRLFSFSDNYLKMLVRIVEKLKINLEKEEKRFGKILFKKTEKMVDFKISEYKRD